MSDAVFNPPTADAQLQFRHQFVHPNTASADTATMTQDVHSNMLQKMASRMNMKQHAIGSELIQIKVNVCQLTIWCTMGVHKELLDQFITAHNG